MQVYSFENVNSADSITSADNVYNLPIPNQFTCGTLGR